MNPDKTKQILIVDDDPDFCYGINRVVTRLGHETNTVSTLAQARAATVDYGCDLVLLDVRLPDGSGLDFLPELKALPSDPEVVIITGAGDARGAELAITNGAWDYIEKTASSKEISLTVNQALLYRAERLSARPSDRVTRLNHFGIIGDSPSMKSALDNVARAAACDANVLITGETGTGKELFARAVHENSRRADRELVVVDCAALPETLAENLLFGHEKGSYTGADTARQGLVRMADRGSLFLDEIGELPLSLQKTLLRVLQEKRFRPLGGGREVKSDFRLIAATNRDLDRMAAEGRFRQDLLFRIRSLHIELPRLRERGKDIKHLARYYIDQHCEAQGLDSKGMSSDFPDTLAAYGWPGNVRELAHTMEHVVVAALNEPTVFSTHLPKPLRVAVVTSGLAGEEAVEPASTGSSGPLPTMAEYREMVLESHEKKYLADLAARAESVASACSTSGLSRSRLYALLKKHGLSIRK